MNIEYHKNYSPDLEREMEIKVYGFAGKPYLIFPTQGGRFYQAEDEGIMEAIRGFLDDGLIQLFAVDSIDYEAWSNLEAHPHQRGIKHKQYENYILKEVIPYIKNRSGINLQKIGLIGFSMGGYHAANFFFKYPLVFDTVIAISGFYNLKLLVGDYSDDLVYFNSPIRYLRNLEDEGILNQIRSGKIIICSGQGAWEEDMLAETLELKTILEEKEIPAWVDIWGEDVNHDWDWWRKMLPYFLGRLGT